MMIRFIDAQSRLRPMTAVASLLAGVLSMPATAQDAAPWTASAPALRVDGEQVPGGCPIESPTGRFLFTARNPGTGLDIFVNGRGHRGRPFNLGAPLPSPANDSAGGNDFCPTPLPDGELYFVSNRTGGCGDADLYRTINNPSRGFVRPANLGCAPDGPNTPGLELSPSLIRTSAGTFLFYSTDFHTGNQDIYRSRMRPDGSFGPGERLPAPINTIYDDRQPNLSPDGLTLVFASDRPTDAGDASGFDIFTATRPSLAKDWGEPVNLSESVPFETVAAGETRPSLSWDGKRLYYGAGGVWVSERDVR